MKRTLLIIIVTIIGLNNILAKQYVRENYSRVRQIKVEKVKGFQIDTTVAMYQSITEYQEINRFSIDFYDKLKLKLSQYNINKAKNTPDSIMNLCDIENINSFIDIKYKNPVVVYMGFGKNWVEGVRFDFEIVGRRNDKCIPVYRADITVSLDGLLTESEAVADEIIKHLVKLKYLPTNN